MGYIFLMVLMLIMLFDFIRLYLERDKYKEMWNTLKATYGYRETIGYCGISESLKNLMEYIEKRKV